MCYSRPLNLLYLGESEVGGADNAAQIGQRGVQGIWAPLSLAATTMSKNDLIVFARLEGAQFQLELVENGRVGLVQINHRPIYKGKMSFQALYTGTLIHTIQMEPYIPKKVQQQNLV
jgi:hypothetical protein